MFDPVMLALGGQGIFSTLLIVLLAGVIALASFGGAIASIMKETSTGSRTAIILFLVIVVCIILALISPYIVRILGLP